MTRFFVPSAEPRRVRSPVAGFVAAIVLLGLIAALLVSPSAQAATPPVLGYSWGLGSSGQLGNSTDSTTGYPVQITSTGSLSGKTLTKVAAGTNFACGLAHDGVVANTRAYCWGEGSSGQLGNGSSSDTTSPVPVAGALGTLQVTEVAAGNNHACAVTVAGEVYCWGSNTSGQLGQGTSVGTFNTPQLVSGGTLSGTVATGVSAGTSFSCAITPASVTKTHCWGLNNNGQVGDGTATDPQDLPVGVVGTVTAITPSSVASGVSHSCVVSTAGSVHCWGLGTSGQLGDGLSATSTSSVTAIGLPVTTNSVNAGTNFTCASTSTGVGYCWGEGSTGQLGNGAGVDASAPVLIDSSGALSGKSVSLIKAGNLNACAITTDGGAYCWGSGTAGALGNNSYSQANSPVAVSTTPGAGVGSYTYIALGTSFANSVFQPINVPGAPSISSAVAGVSSVTVTVTAPADDGGSSITGYTITSSAGQTCSPVLPALSCTVTGLTPGSPYTFTATAINIAGTGPSSAASGAVVPFAVPDAPGGVTAATGTASGTVDVTWTPPNANGSAITSYTVVSSPPGGTGCSPVAAPAASCTVGSLTPGASYTFTVAATNAAGAGPTSPPTTPTAAKAGAPGAPTGLAGIPGNSSIALTWNAPVATGGDPVLNYTANTIAPGPTGHSCTSGTLTCTISGLANGTAYTIEVTATNSGGTSPPSGSVVATPISVPTAPSPPTAAVGAPGNSQIAASWNAPPSDGGSAILSYTATASPGLATCGATFPSTTCTITGLTNGTGYTITVTATNAIGTSTPSAASATLTPVTVPGASTSVTTAAGSGSITASWVAPIVTGGLPITTYTATASPGGASCLATGTSCTISGLANGTSYTVVVFATNAAGTGPASAPSTPVTPATVTANLSIAGGTAVGDSVNTFLVQIGAATPATGTATVTRDGAVICVATIVASSGTCSAFLPLGTVTLAAVFAGTPSSAVSSDLIVSTAKISIHGTIRVKRKRNVAKLKGQVTPAKSRVTIYRINGRNWKTQRVARKRANSRGKWHASVRVGKSQKARFFAVVGSSQSATVIARL